MENIFERRRKQLMEALTKRQIYTSLITSPSNLYYYTGFTGGEAFFLLFCGTGEGYVITDSRYYEQVEKECKNLTLVRLGDRKYSDTVKKLLDTNDTVQSSYGRKHIKNKVVAIEETMTLAQYLKLTKACEEYSFPACGREINGGRMVKDENELACIAKAEEIGDAAFTHILGMIKPGVSETELALELEYFMKKQGASRLSFDTIVASGANSSMPHAGVTDKKVEHGDFITMDFGCVYHGYCSDMTRTVAVGNPTEEMRKVYEVVLLANRRAMEQIEEGKSCKVIDALARDYIKEQGYGDYFGHGLGHSVGLEIHEEPRFSPKCETIVKENMVITVEPGIYLPGQFGVRIEDLVVVKKNGYEKLSHSEKELLIL